MEYRATCSVCGWKSEDTYLTRDEARVRGVVHSRNCTDCEPDNDIDISETVAP